MRVHLSAGQVVIDPLTGKSLGREELLEWLDTYRPRNESKEAFEAPLGLYLQAAVPRDIIARMLRNLKEIYKSQEDWERLLAVQNRLVTLLPTAWHEYRDRGFVHAELGHRERAVQDLGCYLHHAEDILDAQQVSAQMQHLQRQQRF